MNKAIEISQWLKEKGYVHEKDYTWYREYVRDTGFFNPSVVVFSCKNPEVETLIGLTWL